MAFSGDFRVLSSGTLQARAALAALALLLLISIATDVYLLMASTLSASQLVLVLVIQGALLMAGIALLWTWLETRILHPLRMLQDDIDVIIHGNPAHSPEPPEGHGLGSLPDAVNRLAQALSRAHGWIPPKQCTRRVLTPSGAVHDWRQF
jgi:nitrate/nitrite-specific signal transduction histidine kinase